MYVVAGWLKRHRGTILPNGTAVAAPGSLANVVSNLAACFGERGRSSSWQEATSCGNPCLSHEVQQLVRGYDQLQQQAGFRTTGAVPLLWTDVHSTVQYLATAMAKLQPGSLQRTLLCRDGCMLLCLWESCLRGQRAVTPKGSDADSWGGAAPDTLQ